MIEIFSYCVGLFCKNIVQRLIIGDGDLHLYARFQVNGCDLFDDLRRRLEVDDSLVDAHLEAIPRLGALSAGGLTGGNPQDLGR